MIDHPIFLTPAEVAQRWKCSAAHVRKMIDNGELPAFRAGGKLLRVREADLEAYEQRGSTTRRLETQDGSGTRRPESRTSQHRSPAAPKQSVKLS